MATTYNNYSFSINQSKFYLKSKEPKEGYEKVVYGTKQDKVTYHKYESVISGKLKNLEVKEVNFEGNTLQFLELTFIDGDINNKLSLALKNKSGLTEEVKSLVSALYNAEPNEYYTISPQVKKTVGKNGKEYTNISFWLNYKNRLDDNGKSISTGFIPYDQVPKPIKEEGILGVTYDNKPVTNFYGALIKELVLKLSSSDSTANTGQASSQAGVTQGQATATTAESTVKTETPSSIPSDPSKDFEQEDDDLPF